MIQARGLRLPLQPDARPRGAAAGDDRDRPGDELGGHSPRRGVLPLAFTGLWRNPDFVRLWASDAVSGFGSQITVLALPLAAVALGAGPREMGWLAAARTLPVLLFGLVAGTWVDRLPRRPLLIATDLVRAALLCSVPAAMLLGQLRLDLLYAVAFLAGVLALVSQVAHASYLPALVGREQLVEGNSKLAETGQVASVVGPSLGGALVQLVTAPMALLVDALSFVASAVLLGTIRRREARPTAPAERRALWREIGEGLRFVVAHPVLRTLTGAWGLYFLFDALFWGLYPLYVTRELGVSPAGLGLLFAIGGVGGVLGRCSSSP
jgi:MFS family permease